MSKANINKKTTIYYIATYAIMTALLCIFSPMTVPIGPIPISLTTLLLYFSIFLIGWKGSSTSLAVYVLLGIVGLPVFSGYQGGPAKLLGPTGGYIVGYFFITFVAGLTFDLLKKRTKIVITIIFTVIAMILATALLYLFGTVWFVLQMKCEVAYALSVCVFPFMPFDLGKIVIATILGLAVRKPLIKLGFIQ